MNLAAQTEEYTQMSAELQLSKTINQKLTASVWLGTGFSNTPTDIKPLHTNIQDYIFGWVDYYYSARWKFSSSIAYFVNNDVPDIGQYYAPEWRLTLMGVYYIHKLGYTLSTRMRGEFRLLKNEKGEFYDQYRYRQMLKYTKPFNSKVLRMGTFYGFSSDEIFLRANVKTKGLNFFDRNRFELGAGYLITDDIQIELGYSNEYLPRDGGNQLYQSMNISLSMNNLWSTIKKHLGTNPPSDKTKK